MVSLLAALVLQGDPFAEIRAAVASGDKARVLALFPNPSDGIYLQEMLGRKGLEAMNVSIAPCPPGWKRFGPYVVCLHRFNQLEDDHDPLYGTVKLPDGTYRLGKELPEDGGPQKVASLSAEVHLIPNEHRMTAKTVVLINPGSRSRAALIRLGDDYHVTEVPGWRLLDADAGPLKPKKNDIVRVGCFLIPWTTDCPNALRVSYEATLNLKAEGKVAKGIVDIDQIEPTYAILNSYWTPQIGRTAHTARISVTAPKDWVVKSEGELVSGPHESGEEATTVYQNDIPISNPKIVAGKYVVAAEIHQNGKRFRCYELEPIDRAAAQKAVESIAAAETVYSKRLMPFPYSGYDVFQAPKDHYGIESYSYTLEPRSGYHFATHEMAHTYFGGIGVCTYIHDSWNEGLGVYLDDIIFKNNLAALQGGLRSIRYPKPLSQMYFEWGDGSSSYSRGAYVMRMLEAEIGQDKVLEGLALMLKERVGQDTRWRDIRPYQERVSGKRLGWFWDQWIDGGTFPKLEIVRAETTPGSTGYRTSVTVRQTETKRPFQMRFDVKLDDTAMPVRLDRAEATFTFDTPTRPQKASFGLLGLTLAVAGPEMPVTNR